MRYFLLTMWPLFAIAGANYPVFEGTSQLKKILVPADVHIGSVIYRLRASDSDHDYPLQFDATDYGSYVVKVENLPCNANSTYCEANVYLERVLMAGQIFKFRFTVRDTKGDTTTASVSVEVTDAPVDITATFPHLPGIIILPENTVPGTELEYVIVRRNVEHKRPAVLEIRGSSVLDFTRTRSSQETTTGVISLKTPLDFEQRNMYKLQIFALDMYTDKLVDTRNIAGFEIILIVQDVQDTPPIFINVEPTVKLRSNMTQGDVITKVTAVDGDKGNPRSISYGLVSENNPFTIYFNIDRVTGLITLAKPLKQLVAIVRSHQPILLTIIAEEERTDIKESPTQLTTATIALLLADAGNTAPYFDNDHYVCHLNENSPQGTALVFSDAYSTQGKQGVFSLILDKNNGTFEISPNVVERKASFTIRVRNNLLLDYETRNSVEFVIVARELDPGSLSSSVTVLVYLNDVNDNPPQFQRTVYMAQIAENTTANAFVVQVQATDNDTGLAGRVHYTSVLGFRNSSLLLNSVTGVITVASDNHGFDREEASEYHLTVEARDTEGTGLLATVPLILRVLDVNDQTPIFENAPFHFTLAPDLRNFSIRAFVKATDKDAEPPNNIVRYEIISGNYNNKFTLDSETGELTVRGDVSIRKRRQTSTSANVYTLTVRAYDLGVPHRWSTAQVRVFPPDSGTRAITFVIPARGLDYEQMEELLMKITGGRVTIVEIKPYHAHRYARTITEPRKYPKEKSIVVARVTYGDNSVVDVEHVYHLLRSIYEHDAHSDQIQYRMAETSSSLFWILIIILLLLLLAFCAALLLCYLLKCHPCYTLFGKKKNQVSDAAQTVNLHNKGVQANNHRMETHSSTESGHRNPWKFYRRRERDSQPVFLVQKNASPRYRDTIDDVPAFLYRDHLPPTERHGDLYIQDIADTEYHILDPSKLNVQRLDEQQNLRNSPLKREETYLREGRAEILRLQTTDDSVSEQFQSRRTNEYQFETHASTGSSRTDVSKKYEADRNADATLESPRPKLRRSKRLTQDDTEASELVHVVNIEPLQHPVESTRQLEQPETHPIDQQPEDSPQVVDSVTNIDVEPKKSVEQPAPETNTIRNLLDVTHLEEERNRLTSFQRDLLLTRFLVEEQRRFIAQTTDTQSLPGSLSMATQTDRHRSTQTDLLCLMRPEPRRVKSENDDSSDSEFECVYKKGKTYRRCYTVVAKDKPRYKIRTPIIEECENVEGSRNVTLSHRPNKTSLLRMANTRHKITARNAVAEAKSKLDLKNASKSKYRSSNDLHKCHHVSLRDAKKSVSYTDINDARNVLSDKEIYTPRSLKSRIIARRLSASEPPKLGAHCLHHRHRDVRDRRISGEKDSPPVETCKTCRDRKSKTDKCKHHTRSVDKASSESNTSTGTKSGDNVDTLETTLPPVNVVVGGPTLKLKSKNQPLMEKKSVFTIAYDDAAINHLGSSSNGSVQ